MGYFQFWFPFIIVEMSFFFYTSIVYKMLQKLVTLFFKFCSLFLLIRAYPPKGSDAHASSRDYSLGKFWNIIHLPYNQTNDILFANPYKLEQRYWWHTQYQECNCSSDWPWLWERHRWSYQGLNLIEDWHNKVTTIQMRKLYVDSAEDLITGQLLNITVLIYHMYISLLRINQFGVIIMSAIIR